MSKTTLYRLSALAGFLSGASIIIGMFSIPLVGFFPEIVVVIGSIIAGLSLLWWAVDLYRLAGSQVNPV